jgi:hypothetical protein
MRHRGNTLVTVLIALAAAVMAAAVSYGLQNLKISILRSELAAARKESADLKPTTPTPEPAPTAAEPAAKGYRDCKAEKIEDSTAEDAKLTCLDAAGARVTVLASVHATSGIADGGWSPVTGMFKLPDSDLLYLTFGSESDVPYLQLWSYDLATGAHGWLTDIDPALKGIGFVATVNAKRSASNRYLAIVSDDVRSEKDPYDLDRIDVIDLRERRLLTTIRTEKNTSFAASLGFRELAAGIEWQGDEKLYYGIYKPISPTTDDLVDTRATPIRTGEYEIR